MTETTESSGLDPQALTKIADTIRSSKDADLVALLVENFTVTSTSTAPVQVKVPTLTEQHKADLKALPEVFGKVAVTEPRMLTETELRDLVIERDTIDRLMTVMKKRKDETLRENLANHLDRLAEEQGVATEDTDDKGHYFVKQDFPVEGTDRKVQRIVSTSTPTVDSAMLERLHEEGHLTRQEYLSLTSPPVVKRHFDPDKARKAVLKNPALLNKIASAVQAPRKTVTIKVAKDS